MIDQRLIEELGQAVRFQLGMEGVSNDKQYRKYPIPDYLLEAGYKEEDLCYVVHGSSVLLRDRRGKILVEYPVEEIIGCENERRISHKGGRR